jgi:hypothetical protein
MKRATALKARGLLLAAILCQLACSESSPTKIALGNGDSGRTITLSPGDELDITLGSIGNQGPPTVSSMAIRLHWTSMVGIANPGGPTMLYMFIAVSPGQATITIPFSSPSNPPPFVLDVNVR